MMDQALDTAMNICNIAKHTLPRRHPFMAASIVMRDEYQRRRELHGMSAEDIRVVANGSRPQYAATNGYIRSVQYVEEIELKCDRIAQPISTPSRCCATTACSTMSRRSATCIRWPKPSGCGGTSKRSRHSRGRRRSQGQLLIASRRRSQPSIPFPPQCIARLWQN
jgi:hypothetical protein